MIAVDTNVLARLVLMDHAEQSAVAATMLAEPVWVATSVWLELGWVLHTRLRLDRDVVADAIRTLLDMQTVNTTDRDGLIWAVERYRGGADWADMVHLVSVRTMANRFATFDQQLQREAGAAAPLPIETLA